MAVKKVNCKIAGFLLNRAKFIRVEMIRHEPGDLIVDQVNKSLVFISESRTYLYSMSYAENCSNPYAVPPPGQLGWGDYRLKIDVECHRDEQPELFLEILESTKKRYRRRGYNVYVNGKHDHYTLTRKKMVAAVQLIKDARKYPDHLYHDKYKNIHTIKIVDPSGNDTLLINDPSKAHYNMTYVELED